MYWFPKTRIGRNSFWLGIASFAGVFIQYWFSMIFNTSVFISAGITLLGVLTSGVMSVIALIKHKDRAYLLFVPLLIGLWGVFMITGEIFFEH